MNSATVTEVHLDVYKRQGYTFKEADLSKDKSSSSAEIKDGDGIVYEVTAVKGKGEEFSIAGNTLKLKGVKSQANGDVPTEDYGYVKISVKKDCTKTVSYTHLSAVL